MYLFLAFLLVPIIEIALFIQVGGLIGLFPTLAIVIATAVLGTYLVRTQGRAAIARLRGAFSDLRDPAEPLADGAMILLAGALLLTPGFFTDALGFALLTPAIRRGVFNYLRNRITVARFSYGNGQSHSAHSDPGRRPTGPDIIEGEFEEVPPPDHAQEQTGRSRPSGWSRGDGSGH